MLDVSSPTTIYWYDNWNMKMRNECAFLYVMKIRFHCSDFAIDICKLNDFFSIFFSTTDNDTRVYRDPLRVLRIPIIIFYYVVRYAWCHMTVAAVDYCAKNIIPSMRSYDRDLGIGTYYIYEMYNNISLSI